MNLDAKTLKLLLKVLQPKIPKWLNELKKEVPEIEDKAVKVLKAKSNEKQDFAFVLLQKENNLLLVPALIDDQNILQQTEINGKNSFLLSQLLDTYVNAENIENLIDVMTQKHEN